MNFPPSTRLIHLFKKSLFDFIFWQTFFILITDLILFTMDNKRKLIKIHRIFFNFMRFLKLWEKNFESLIYLFLRYIFLATLNPNISLNYFKLNSLKNPILFHH